MHRFTSLIVVFIFCLLALGCSDDVSGGADTHADSNTHSDSGSTTDTNTSSSVLDTSSAADTGSASDSGLDTSSTADTGSTSDSESDTQINPSCTEGQAICSNNTVLKCNNNEWVQWDDCLFLDQVCVVLQGVAQCRAPGDTTSTDSNTTDTDSGNIDTEDTDTPDSDPLDSDSPDSDTTIQCYGMTTLCTDSCVYLESDVHNCGDCGYDCVLEEGSNHCMGGVCRACVNTQETKCGDTCVDLSIDSSNCGECGYDCQTEEGLPNCINEACTNAILLTYSEGVTLAAGTYAIVTGDNGNPSGTASVGVVSDDMSQGVDATITVNGVTDAGSGFYVMLENIPVNGEGTITLSGAAIVTLSW